MTQLNHGRRPEAGPRLLFFTGGSALRDVSRSLVAHTLRSIHLVTPFDSGGSSAALRAALGVPAVGDLRNRLLALAVPRGDEDRSLVSLLGRRLPKRGDAAELWRRLDQTLADAPPPVVEGVRTCLVAGGADLDLRHASVGNLFLAGAWLTGGRSLGAAVARFTDLVPVGGSVAPVTEAARHLAAVLDDGSVVSGQHRLTRGSDEIEGRRIERLHLVRDLHDARPCPAPAAPDVAARIAEADLICYPVGSFWTSVVAALLPRGIASAIAASAAPKVYVPNPPGDPEERGRSLTERVAALARAAGMDGARGFPITAVLDTVLVAEEAPTDTEVRGALEALGLRVVAAPLRPSGDPPRYDGDALARALLAIAEG